MAAVAAVSAGNCLEPYRFAGGGCHGIGNRISAISAAKRGSLRIVVHLHLGERGWCVLRARSGPIYRPRAVCATKARSNCHLFAYFAASSEKGLPHFRLRWIDEGRGASYCD